MVRPTIVKGRRISHINGSRKINTSARGQHRASKMNQRMIANKVFIYELISTSRLTNVPPILKPHNFWLVQHCQVACPSISVHFDDQKCTVDASQKIFLRTQSSQINFILSLHHAKTNSHISIPRSQFRSFGIAALDFQLSFYDYY